MATDESPSPSSAGGSIISEEMPSTSFNDDGSIAGGTVQSFIDLLLSVEICVPSDDCIFAFLLNIRMFDNMPEILHTLLKTFIFNQNSKTENFLKANRQKLAAKVLRLLSVWCEEFACDFCSDQMKKRLSELLDTCCSTDRSFSSHKFALIDNLRKKLVKLSRIDKEAFELQHKIEWCNSRLDFPGTSYDILNDDLSPKDMAGQLLLIEQEKMKPINAEEFVYMFDVHNLSRSSFRATVQSKHSFAVKIAMAKNAQNYICWCNRLAYFVATEICKRNRLKARIRVVEFFIEVAKECFNNGNFNSTVGIISGFSMPSVRRLHKTWAKLDCSKLSALEQALSPKKNFADYRSTLQAAIWRSENGNSGNQSLTNDIIPAFSVLCRDLYAMHVHCRKVLPNGQLNFNAFRKFTSIVKSFLQWKKYDVVFEKTRALRRYVLTAPILEDKDLEVSSYECESPENQQEKISFKKLRSDFSKTPAAAHSSTL